MSTPAHRPPPARRRAAVIYPYSTGRDLGPALTSAGITAIAVVPLDPRDLGMTGPPLARKDWSHVLTDPGCLMTDPDESGDLAAMLDGADWILPGDETAVPLAEELAAKLGVPGNDPATTRQRTRKTSMHEGLHRAGIPGPRTIAATTLAQACEAASRIGYPVIVKPDWSASSVGVTACHGPAALATAFAQLIGQRGALGEPTEVIAVQEYLDGGKWTVDTVTVPGPSGRPVHKITSMWRERVTERAGHFAWAESWLVPPADLMSVTDPQAPALRVAAYTLRVLDAAGVVWGPACTEVILTAAGPKLTEVMARLAGCYPVGLVEEVCGHNQVTATVDLLTDPAALAVREPAAGDGRAVAQAWLAARQPGWINGHILHRMRALPTVRALSPGLVPDAHVTETTDSLTSPGRLDLCGPPAQVQADINAIRTLEPVLYRRHQYPAPVPT